ncbi:MAG TPA: hypothetical protein VM509_10305, partial [Planctomycetota bacterium]|nr:hypothetical protein [Planctomycetota bacterium]
MKKIALALGLCLLASLPLIGHSTAREDAASLTAEIKQVRDDADPEKIKTLAALRSREAMTGLVECYGVMASIYLRLEILRTLPTFDGVADAEQKALEKLMEVATSATEPELRDAAVEGLGQCKHLGKHFLELIVDSPAEDAVREHAMRCHIAMAADTDLVWYTKEFEFGTSKDKKKPKKGGKDEEPDLAVHPLARVREMALQQIAGKLEVAKLVETAKEKEKDASDLRKDGLRRIALKELSLRKGHDAATVAADVYKDSGEKSLNRILAAQILFEDQKAKIAAQFIDDADKVTTQLDLAYACADLIAKLEDASVDAKIVKLIGK